LKKIITIAVVLYFGAACGDVGTSTDEAEEEDQSSNDTTAEESEKTKTLQRYLVLKVPKDAEGNELLDQVVTHEFTKEKRTALNGIAMEKAFNAGTDIKIDEEFDEDSSEGQWWRWGRRSWYWGRGYRAGYWSGARPYYGDGYGNGYYRSRYSYGGYYGAGSYYGNGNGCNYYYYY